ncbi:hypothetical protein T492DRAFT_958413 [Pavlovales sp. CCMP2436]|nr:hypothetical protein T492DRAFT_958413 [Pavlovales sp. CCMP2436]
MRRRRLAHRAELRARRAPSHLAALTAIAARAHAPVRPRAVAPPCLPHAGGRQARTLGPPGSRADLLVLARERELGRTARAAEATLALAALGRGELVQPQPRAAPGRAERRPVEAMAARCAARQQQAAARGGVAALEPVRGRGEGPRARHALRARHTCKRRRRLHRAAAV